MKIHKVDKERVYFIMDSGACGSIKREDAWKFSIIHMWVDTEKTDPRKGECIAERVYRDIDV